MPTLTDRIGYCRKCGNDLRASEDRCPECGRSFQWQARRTYRAKPLSRFPWKRLWQSVAVLSAIVLLALAIIVGPDYWQWRQNKRAIDVVTKAGGTAGFGRRRPPPRWTAYLGHRWDFLGDRVEQIGAHPRGPTPWPRPYKMADADLKELTGLKELRSLNLNEAPGVTDVGLEYIGQIESLEILNLEDAQVTDAGLAHLKKLKHLTRLDLGPHSTTTPSRVTDVGFKEIGQITSLTFLDLERVPITRAGLRELQNLKKLDLLWLIRTDVTDETLQEIKEFKSLRYVNLNDNSKLTGAGVNQLRAACPAIRISFVPLIH